MGKQVYDWSKVKVGGVISINWKKRRLKSALSGRQTLLRSAAYFRERVNKEFRVETKMDGDRVVATRVA